MFNLGNFIEDCKVSISNDQSHLGIKELVESAVSSPGDLIAALGPLEKAGATTMYHSDELTIVNVTWAPWMTVFPIITTCGQSLVYTQAGKTTFFGEEQTSQMD